MPKKTKVIEVACPKERASVPFEENEPVGAQEVEEVEEAQEAAPEVEEIKTKPKRLLSEKQLETLALARVKAAEVKKKNKEEKLKALSLSKKENEIKALEYDKLEEKKKQLLEAPKAVKKTTKKVIEVEEEEEEEEIIKKPIKKVVNNNNNNSLSQDASMLTIQQKLKLERQKMLMSTLSPMC
jgi:predicted acylesterase/phospholipase RssA